MGRVLSNFLHTGIPFPPNYSVEKLDDSKSEFETILAQLQQLQAQLNDQQQQIKEQQHQIKEQQHRIEVQQQRNEEQQRQMKAFMQINRARQSDTVTGKSTAFPR